MSFPVQTKEHNQDGGTRVPSLAEQVRDQLVLDQSVVIQVINDVLSSMPKHTSELFRRGLASSPSFAEAIKRVAIDVGVVLSMAKAFESDEAFGDSVGVIHDIPFGAHEGKVGVFAKAMVQCDINELMYAEAGDLANEDALLYDMVPVDILERRLRLLLAFIEEAIKRERQ